MPTLLLLLRRLHCAVLLGRSDPWFVRGIAMVLTRIVMLLGLVGGASSATFVSARAEIREVQLLSDESYSEQTAHFVELANEVLRSIPECKVLLVLHSLGGKALIAKLKEYEWTLASVHHSAFQGFLLQPAIGLPSPIGVYGQPLSFDSSLELITYQNSQVGSFLLNTLGRHEIVGLSYLNFGTMHVLGSGKKGSIDELSNKTVLVPNDEAARGVGYLKMIAERRSQREIKREFERDASQLIVLSMSDSGSWPKRGKNEKYWVSPAIESGTAVIAANGRAWDALPFFTREAIGFATREAAARVDKFLLNQRKEFVKHFTNPPFLPAVFDKDVRPPTVPLVK